MNQLKKLAGQTVIYGISTILPRFLNYLLVPLFTYTFTNPEDFGINTEIYSYISFLNILLTYGMETAFFNFVNSEEDKPKVYSTALISLLSTTSLFVLLAFAARTTIAELLEYSDKTIFITWMILIIASDALMAIPFAKLRAEQKAIKFASVKMVNILVNIGLNIFFIHFCKNAYETDITNGTTSTLGSFYDPQIGIGYAFLANVIANLVSLLILTKEFLVLQWQPDFSLLKRMLAYALPMLIVGLAGMVNETFDRIVLKKLLPPDTGMHDLGVYGACYKISILMSIFIQAFRFAAEPFFFSNARQADAKQLNAQVMKYFVIFCSLIFLGTMMNLSWIKYFVSENYWEGLHVVPVLLLANLFLGIYYNLSVWYKVTDNTRYGALITIFGAAITLFVNFVFIPKFSYTASAWATFFSYFGMMVLSYYLGKRYYPVRYNIRSFIFFFGFAILFFGVSLLYKEKFGFYPELILNNILLAVYFWLFMKFEYPNLKKSN